MLELLFLVGAFAPLFLIIVLANVAQARRATGSSWTEWGAIAYLLLAFLYLLGVIAGVALALSPMAIAQQPELFEQYGLDPTQLLESVDSLAVVGLGIWLPSAIGLLLMLPPLRKLVARFTGLDAENPVHGVAIALSMLILINLISTLGVGLGNLTSSLQAQEQATLGSGAASMGVLWTQQLLMALLALVGVGWGTRRSLREALARLGLVRPTGRQVWIGVGLGLALIPAAMLLLGASTWLGFGADPDVEALTEQLLGALFRTPLGIFTLGAAAALGEETLLRGAVQPRFGLWLTALLFALLHSNYGISISTVVVFLLGLVLGRLRIVHNTSTSMITHAVFNSTQGLIAYLSLQFLKF